MSNPTRRQVLERSDLVRSSKRVRVRTYELAREHLAEWYMPKPNKASGCYQGTEIAVDQFVQHVLAMKSFASFMPAASDYRFRTTVVS